MNVATVMSRLNLAVPEHLVADAAIPVLTGMQRQGDVLVVPTRPGAVSGAPVPAEGVILVQGENMRTSHVLIADGSVTVALRNAGQDVATVTVPDGATAWLVHDGEHGPRGIGAGQYLIRRQREQADVIALVAD